MPNVQIMPAAPAIQVEGFPKGSKDKPFKRSCEGALHLRPGSTRVITADELGFIRKNLPKLARFIRVITEDKAIKAVPAKQDAPSKADQAKADALSNDTDKAGESPNESPNEVSKGKGGKSSKR